MAIDRIGVQPVIATVGQAMGRQTYVVGEVSGDEEVVSTQVGCTNDLSAEGNLNLIHWRGEGESYRVYKSISGTFGLIGTSDAALFIDDNKIPDLDQQPPGA